MLFVVTFVGETAILFLRKLVSKSVALTILKYFDNVFLEES